MTDQSINLLTKEEKSEQFKHKAIKFSSVFSVLLVIIIGLVSGYYFFKVTTLKGQIKTEEQKITQARSDIESMESVEILARSLYKKYLVLKGLFEDRIYYSELLENFYAKVPEGVTVSSFTFERDNTLAIRGTAEDYLLVSQFLAKFNDSEARSNSEVIFSSAYLNSVKSSTSSKVEYNMTISYNPEVLKHGLEQGL